MSYDTIWRHYVKLFVTALQNLRKYFFIPFKNDNLYLIEDLQWVLF